RAPATPSGRRADDSLAASRRGAEHASARTVGFAISTDFSTPLHLGGVVVSYWNQTRLGLGASRASACARAIRVAGFGDILASRRLPCPRLRSFPWIAFL